MNRAYKWLRDPVTFHRYEVIFIAAVLINSAVRGLVFG